MKRTQLLKLFALSLPLSLVVVAPNPVLAGKGTMTRVATSDTEHPGAGEHVHVTLGLHVGFIPTTDRLNEIKAQTRKASRMLCDATDGKFLITDVTLGHNGQSADDADIFWYGGKFLGRYKSEGGPFGTEGSRIRVDEGGDFKVVAHELAHNLFGLRDSYNRQRDTNNGHPACGYGPAVESPLTASHHSIMQAYDTICWNPATDEMSDPPTYCTIDEHCVDDDPDWVCSEFSDTASELGRADGWDAVRGDGAPYPALDVGQTTAGGLAGEQLWLSLRLYNDLSTDWVNGKTWRQHYEDLQRTADAAGIEFADSLGDYKIEFEDPDGDVYRGGSRHFIYLRVKHDTNTNQYLLEAFIDTDKDVRGVDLSVPPAAGSPQAQVLEWRITGTNPNTGIVEVKTSNTLELGFAGSALVGDPLSYPLERLQGLYPQALELTIYGHQLTDFDGPGGDVDAYGHPQWAHNDDVTLPVDFSDIIHRDESNSWSGGFKIIADTFDPVTGYGSGTFVGRRAPAGQGQNLSPDPVYMQLYKCTPDEVDTRWNGEIQQFAESYTYEWWRNCRCRSGSA